MAKYVLETKTTVPELGKSILMVDVDEKGEGTVLNSEKAFLVKKGRMAENIRRKQALFDHNIEVPQEGDLVRVRTEDYSLTDRTMHVTGYREGNQSQFFSEVVRVKEMDLATYVSYFAENLARDSNYNRGLKQINDEISQKLEDSQREILSRMDTLDAIVEETPEDRLRKQRRQEYEDRLVRCIKEKGCARNGEEELRMYVLEGPDNLTGLSIIVCNEINVLESRSEEVALNFAEVSEGRMAVLAGSAKQYKPGTYVQASYEIDLKHSNIRAYPRQWKKHFKKIVKSGYVSREDFDRIQKEFADLDVPKNKAIPQRQVIESFGQEISQAIIDSRKEKEERIKALGESPMERFDAFLREYINQ